MEGVAQVQHLATKFKEIPNQAIHYYFFPYLWDFLGVLQTCNTFVMWLGMSNDQTCQIYNHTVQRKLGCTV